MWLIVFTKISFTVWILKTLILDQKVNFVDMDKLIIYCNPHYWFCKLLESRFEMV